MVCAERGAARTVRKWLEAGGQAGGGDDKAGAARSGRSDSAAAKLVTGANYVELEHACNPFEPCAQCAQALAGSRWLEARTALAAVLQGLGGVKR